MPDALVQLLFVIWLVLFVVKGWAFVDCAIRSSSDFQRVETLQKPAWLIILALAVLCDAFLSGQSPLSLLSLVGTVAAFVYLAQLRGNRY